MENYRSSFSNNVVEQVRKLLLNYELLEARVETEIALRDELMNFYEGSVKKADLQKFIDAKIEKENFEVFLSRIRTQKKDLMRKVSLVADKYEGEYGKIFVWFFFEKKSVEEISKLVGFKPKKTSKIVERMKEDIIDVYKKKEP